MNNHNISDEYLNSFVDNQLDPSEKIHAFGVIGSDDQLKERVCELRSIKEIMQQAYKHTSSYMPPSSRSMRHWPARFQALAACLLLMLGVASGWLSHAWSSNTNGHEITAIKLATQATDAAAETRKIIVHVSSDTPRIVKAALDETEGLLDTYKRANRLLQIEVIANKRGVDMLRHGVSPEEKRISLLQQKYPNLSFMVCGQTVGKLLKDGESVQLLPHTGVATSAADQINKRLHQGWGYVRI